MENFKMKTNSYYMKLLMVSENYIPVVQELCRVTQHNPLPIPHDPLVIHLDAR